jgi:hypothetical protein
MYVINARLSPEEGALVLKALEIEVDEIKRAQRGQQDLGAGDTDTGDAGALDTDALDTHRYKQQEEVPELKVDSKNVSAETFAGSDHFNEDCMNVRASALTPLAEAYLLCKAKEKTSVSLNLIADLESLAI